MTRMTETTESAATQDRARRRSRQRYHARVVGTAGRSDLHSAAAMLANATRQREEIDRYVEGLLMIAFPGWRPLAPRLRGWRFSMPDAIDVYRAVPSVDASDTLRRAGFNRVTAHPHDDLEICRCRPVRSTPVPARAPTPTSTPTPAAPPDSGSPPAASQTTDEPDLLEVEIEQIEEPADGRAE